MESSKNELRKSNLEKLIKRTSTRDSLDFDGLDSYIKQGEQNMLLDQKGFNSRVSLVGVTETSDLKTQASEASYFKREISINKVPLKDQLMLSDFVKYYKFGIFPYIVFIHILIVSITTFIIVDSCDDMSIFRAHRRNLLKIFIVDDPSNALTKKDYSDHNTILDIKSLIENFDSVIEKIFNFDNLFSHHLIMEQNTTYKLDLKYKPEFVPQNVDKRVYEIPIMNNTDNFFESKSPDEIRDFLRYLTEMSIQVKYKFSLHGDKKELCSNWTLLLKWHVADRATINFHLETFFYDCRENLFFFIFKNFNNGYAIFNLLLIILSICELVIVISRIWDSYKNFLLIQFELNKNNLDETLDLVQNPLSSINSNYNNFLNSKENYLTNFENEKDSKKNNNNNDFNNSFEESNFYGRSASISENNDLNANYLNIKKLTTKNKWDLLRFSDKRKLFNMWLVLFALGNIFQIFSGFINLIFPIFGQNNMLFNSVSCMLAWFAIGYFLDYEEENSFFYKILKKSSSSYLKYMLFFGILFCAFVILGISVFSNFNKFSSFSSGAIFFFSMIFADNMLVNYTAIGENRPFLLAFIAFCFFLFFNILTMKIMTSLTEDAFDHAKMKSNYSWLDKKISIQEYIMSQADAIKDEDSDLLEESEANKVDNKKTEHPKYLLNDVFLQLLLMRENQLSEKINEYLIKKDSKLKKDFLFRDEIEFNIIVKKKLKKIKKNLLSKNLMNNIIEHDKENDPLQVNLELGKTDCKNKKLKNYYDYGELIFKCVLNHFQKIGNIVYVDKKIFFKNLNEEEKNEIMKKVIMFTDKVLMRISRFSNNTQPKLKRMNTAGNIIFTLDE